MPSTLPTAAVWFRRDSELSTRHLHGRRKRKWQESPDYWNSIWRECQLTGRALEQKTPLHLVENTLLGAGSEWRNY